MPHEYSGGERLRVFILFGGGASSGIGLATGEKHKDTYEVVGAGTNKDGASGIDKLQSLGVDVLEPFDYGNFCEQGEFPPKDEDSRQRYDNAWLEKIEPFKPDVIALSGWMRILSKEFLQQYPDTKNVHPVPLVFLTERLPTGKVRLSYNTLIDVSNMDPEEVVTLRCDNDFEIAFKGEDAVSDYLLCGYGRGVGLLRSTVHRATERYDEGPIEVMSAPVGVDWDRAGRLIRRRDFGALIEYAHELQGELKVKGDVPAFRTAVELTAERRLEHRDGAVYVDGKRLPYKGFQLTD